MTTAGISVRIQRIANKSPERAEQKRRTIPIQRGSAAAVELGQIEVPRIFVAEDGDHSHPRLEGLVSDEQSKLRDCYSPR